MLKEVARWPFGCIIFMPCASELFSCASCGNAVISAPQSRVAWMVVGLAIWVIFVVYFSLFL